MPSRKLLIVDDEPTIIDLLQDIFLAEGYQVAVAGGAATALDRLQAEPWDVLLTDISMPQMDGLELIQQARRLQPWIVALVFTGKPALETARQALKAGVSDYIAKPFDIKEITSAVAQAWERELRWREEADHQRLSLFSRLAQALKESRGDRDFLGHILESALALTGASKGSIILRLNGDRLATLVSTGETEHSAASSGPDTKGGTPSWSCRNGEWTVSLEKGGLAPPDSEEAANGPVAAFPLSSHGQAWGVLTVSGKSQPFTRAQVDFLSFLAAQAAQWLECNARVSAGARNEG